MENKILKLVGYWLLALLLIVASVILIHWAVGFVKWLEIDSGWTQAIGSLAALGTAVFVMSRQNAHSTRLMLAADRRAASGLASSVEAIVDRAYRELMDGADAMDDAARVGGTFMKAVAAIRLQRFPSVRHALINVPLHQLGRHELVVSVMTFINTIESFEKTIAETAAGTLSSEVIPGRADEVRGYARAAKIAYTKGFAELMSPAIDV